MKVFGLQKNAIMEAFSSARVTLRSYGPEGKKGLPLATVFTERGAKRSSAKLLKIGG